jgi:hypothetical protein
MLQRFQDRVGTAGLIVAIVALVLALGGGAYAASGALTSKQKKEVEKIAKKYAGKPGVAGATGPAGAAGGKGDAGSNGNTGPEGKQGPEGKRGPEGEEGLEGSPWIVGSLPSGKTEMGTWSFGEAAAAGVQYAPVSFSVPLGVGSTVAVHYVNAAGNEEEEGEVKREPATHCLGTNVDPSAPSGTLCLYESFKADTFFEGALSQGPAGEVLYFISTAAGANARGSWAVTAP